MTTSLTDAARSVWAKSTRDDSGWLPLYMHLSDSAAIMGHLWDEWLPLDIRARISRSVAGSDDDGRRLAQWMAGVHDIGKATPAFAVQVEALLGPMLAAGLETPTSLPDRKRLPHSLAGHLILRRRLVARGWDGRTAATYAVVPGGHHGVPPTRRDLRPGGIPGYLMGTGRWVEVQDELLDRSTRLCQVGDLLDRWRDHPLDAQTQMLLTGAVIVADWLASNADLFPYEIDTGSRERAARAWDRLDMPGPWQPTDGTPSVADLFRDRFARPDPRPVQATTVEVARSLDAPGLMIVEAPMGEGKTEAALAAAEVLAGRFGLGGVFVALPTMATSDAMFSRVHAWLDVLPDRRGAERQTFFLAHGKAALNDEYRGIMHGRVRGVGQDESTDGSAWPGDDDLPPEVVIAHEWLFGRKKGVLSNFVVGTVDQVLFMALQARHVALRHLALAGKVVIVDEVHAYDAYMNVYLDRALEWLGAYGVPVVLLSATLPAGRRRELLQAYTGVRTPSVQPATGQGTASQGAFTASTAGSPVSGSDLRPGSPGDVGYPVVVAATTRTTRVEPAARSSRATEVHVELAADDDTHLVDLLQGRLHDGGCVGVIRNTVGRAQETARLLEEHFPGDVVLAHSRFLSVDRMVRENELRLTLGPAEVLAAAGRHRPHRRIVVGTQVLEQSLDIDFDLLVTDLAPIDLVLQRMGRLHRHPRSRPPALAEARCVVVGVEDWQAEPPEAVAVSQLIYGPEMLLRSAAVLTRHLRAHGGVVSLPGDLSGLIQDGYREVFGVPEAWTAVFETAQEDTRKRMATKREKAKTFLLRSVPPLGRSVVGLLDRSVGEADEREGQAQVRDTEDTIEVIVLHRLGEELHLLPWIEGGALLDTHSEPLPRLARTAATCTVRLPQSMCRYPKVFDAVLTDLERNGFAAWQQSAWLKGQLLLVLDEDLHAEVAGFHVAYDPDRGLLVDGLPRKGDS